MPLSSDPDLDNIRENLLMMSSLADRNLGLAVRALTERDSALCDMVESEDSQIDALEVAIDEQVITYMALNSPVATDCRFMLVACKVSGNFERVGDEAVSIARRARQLNAEPAMAVIDTLAEMAELALEMLRDSVRAFIEGDIELTRAIKKRDKEVDRMEKRVADNMREVMEADPSKVASALKVVMITRSLERVADHAKNVAEEIFYLFEARDIRHVGAGTNQPRSPGS
ncbi:MAG: phosphate signaling complex protein PhoU [Verrucomicrobiota bacterium]